MLNFNPFPEIKTDRLLLRRIEISDGDMILFLRSDKTVTKFIERPESRQTKNMADAIKFINELDGYFETNKSISWGITLKNESKIIGTICLWNFSENNKIAEVGYDLDPKFQGNGFMNESLKAIVSFGFNKLDLGKIEAFTHQENENSKRLLEKNGFKFNADRVDEENILNVIYELESKINHSH